MDELGLMGHDNTLWEIKIQETWPHTIIHPPDWEKTHIQILHFAGEVSILETPRDMFFFVS